MSETAEEAQDSLLSLYAGYDVEDLPSNYIGLLMAADGIKGLNIKDVRPWLEKNCGPILSQAEAKKVCDCCDKPDVKGRWVGQPKSISDLSKPSRRSVSPSLDGNKCNTKCQGSSESQLFDDRAPNSVGQHINQDYFTVAPYPTWTPWKNVRHLPPIELRP